MNPSVSLAGDVYITPTLRSAARHIFRNGRGGGGGGSRELIQRGNEGRAVARMESLLRCNIRLAYKSGRAFRSYYYDYYYYYHQGISLVVTFHLFWRLRWDCDRGERAGLDHWSASIGQT